MLRKLQICLPGLLALIAALLLSGVPQRAAAQDWQLLDPAYGSGYGTCQPDGTGFICLALVCAGTGEDFEKGFAVHLLRSASAGEMANAALMRLDGGAAEFLSFQRPKTRPGLVMHRLSRLGVDARLLGKLADSRTLDLTTDRTRRFSLSGFRPALENVARTCRFKDRGPLSIEEIRALAEEERSRFSPGEGTFSYEKLVDVQTGGPLLAAGPAKPEDCLRHCLAQAACQVATYDRGGTCRLQGEITGFQPAPGITSLHVSMRPARMPHPAIPGPAVVEATGIRWQTGDSAADYVARRRQTARPMGEACPAEAAAVDTLARQLQIDPLPPHPQAGEGFELGWRVAQPLAMRVPVWLVVSSDKPLRFSGDGAFALLPGAIGPFGLEFGADRHRAFVPLFEGRDITQGRIGLTALEAGEQQIDIALVAWHRACLQERIAARMQVRLDVRPGKPALLVQDPVAPPAWTQLVPVPEFGRELLLAKGRVLLRDTRTRTEILSRDAEVARLSPTRRFLVIETEDRKRNTRHEIIDILDGRPLLDLRGSPPTWWNGDSFVLTNNQPFGRMQVFSTALPRALSSEVETDSSCCRNEGGVLLNVDLENALVQIARTDFSLLDGQELGTRNISSLERELANASGIGGFISPVTPDVIGTVAPMNAERLWNTPLGPFVTHMYRQLEEPRVVLTQVAQPAARALDVAGEARLALSALPPTLRGFTAPDRPPTGDGLRLALLRWGVSAAPEALPQIHAPEGVTDSEAPDEVLALYAPILRQRVEADLTPTGHYAHWATYEDYAAENDLPGRYMSYCNYSPQMSDLRQATTPELRAALTSEADLDRGLRFQPLAGRVIWLLRSYCQSGPTGGTQVVVSSLNIFDSAYPEPNLALHRVDSTYTMRSAYQTGIAGLYETDFQAKLVGGRYILTYAPGLGVMMVYDLVTRRFLLREATAWQGSLLQDVFLDSTMRALFQINADNSFAVYPLPAAGVETDTVTASPALYGRYLDDELVTWTPDYRFDATEEGASFIGLRFPGVGGAHTLDQFAADRHVPDLLRKVLDGTDLPEIAPLTPPPMIRGALSRGSSGLSGILQWEAQASPVALHIHVDGRQVASLKVDPGATFQRIALPLPAGARWAVAVGVDARGQTSRPVSVDLGPDPAGALPRTHFLGVGIDRYSDPALSPLNYGKSDVLLVSQSLAALDGQTIDLVSSKVLADRRATPEAILAQTRAILAQSRPGDHLVMHFAGHGLRDASGAFYLAQSATRLDDLAGSALSWEELARVFDGHDLRVTVLLDACHAGAAALGGNDGVAETLRARMPPGLTVIAAAKGRQTSGEDAAAGGGLFSTAVAKVLGSGRTQYDNNGNGILEAIEFYRGVKSLVTARRGAEQTPWLARNQAVGENGLF